MGFYEHFELYAVAGIVTMTILCFMCTSLTAKRSFMKNTDVFRLLRNDGIWYIWHNLRGHYEANIVICLLHQGGLITREQESDYLNQFRKGIPKSITISGGRYTDVKNITINFFKDHLGSVAVEMNEDEMTHEEAYNHYKAKISSILGEGDDLGAGSACNWRNVTLAQGNEFVNTTMVVLYLPSDDELVELGKESQNEENLR